MREERLIVKKRMHKKYNSYKGEITPAVDSLIKRNLSPIIDCFDGMPVCWTVGTSTNADLANTMLKCAISTLKPDEHPIIHSDRGCSPDNSACEGFFGHMKMEMFYGRDWSNSTLEDLIQAINEYMDWYCTSRIKSILGGLSPLEYRRRLGVGV